MRRVENTIPTPRIGYVTDGAFAACYRSAVDSIKAFIAGDPVLPCRLAQGNMENGGKRPIPPIVRR